MAKVRIRGEEDEQERRLLFSDAESEKLISSDLVGGKQGEQQQATCVSGECTLSVLLNPRRLCVQWRAWHGLMWKWQHAIGYTSQQSLQPDFQLLSVQCHQINIDYNERRNQLSKMPACPLQKVLLAATRDCVYESCLNL